MTFRNTTILLVLKFRIWNEFRPRIDLSKFIISQYLKSSVASLLNANANANAKKKKKKKKFK